MRKIVVMALTLGLLLASFYYKPVPVARANGCISPPSGMVSWWPGDGAANDQMGINPGTAMNGATYATGMVGQGFSFDGVDDYVEMPSGVGDFGSTPFTVDFWMYSNNTGNYTYLMGKSHPDGGLGWDIRLHASKIRLEGTDGWAPSFNWESDASATPNSWHHIAISSLSDSISVYIDGVLKGTTTRSTISASPNPFRIGWTTNYGGTAFNGLIDEVEIFNRALSQTEIQSIYNAGSAGKCKSCVTPPSGMVSWWPGDGNANDIQDSNNGTLQNGATYATGMVGQAFSFDGVDDYVEIPNDPSLNPSNAFTVDGWFYIDPNASGNAGEIATLVAKTEGSTNNGWALYFDDRGSTKSLKFVLGSMLELQNAILTPSWYHITGVFDPSATPNIKLYINGTIVASVNGGGATANTLNVRIGAMYWTDYYHQGNDRFNGKADEVEFFNRALSTTEIQSIYNAGSAGKCKTAQCVTPPANMISWWPGDGHPNDIQDGNNGTLVNGATYAAGMVGQAFSLDGVNDYVSVANSTSLKPAQFTIDIWVRAASFNTGNYNSVVSYGSLTGVEDPYYIGLAAGVPTFITQHTSGQHNLSAPSSITLNEWHHIAVSFDGSTKSMYLDGSLVASTGIANPIVYGTDAPLLIGEDLDGGSPAGIPFSGLIDEVEIFNRALSLAEIQSIYNAGSLGKCKPPQTLNVTKVGTGTGTVTSNPTGIDCGSTCSYAFDYDTDVTLSAVANIGSTFTGWSGEGCSGTGTCTVDMTQARNVTATFTINTFAVTANANGNGTGTVSSNVGGINYNYPANNTGTTSSLNYGMNVVLTAVAGTGSTASWNDCIVAGGTVAGNGTATATCTFGSLDNNKTVMATFTLNTYTLTVNINPPGGGTVTDTGINCPGDCTETVNYNTNILLTATPATGYTFINWSGCDVPSGNTCTMTMTADKTVTANFTLSQKKKIVLPSMLPAVQNNITKGNELLKQAQDLLSQAKDKNLDTGACEKLINEAKELIDKSVTVKTNHIYANNLALKALEKLKQAIECLKALIG